jgi:hypothetical protein
LAIILSNTIVVRPVAALIPYARNCCDWRSQSCNCPIAILSGVLMVVQSALRWDA